VGMSHLEFRMLVQRTRLKSGLLPRELTKPDFMATCLINTLMRVEHCVTQPVDGSKLRLT
jgi:hypothetical protein